MCELTENAYISREMRETWHVSLYLTAGVVTWRMYCHDPTLTVCSVS